MLLPAMVVLFMYSALLVNFVGLEKSVTKMSKNDEKLPYLHRITERKFLVCNKHMGLCLHIKLSRR